MNKTAVEPVSLALSSGRKTCKSRSMTRRCGGESGQHRQGGQGGSRGNGETALRQRSMERGAVRGPVWLRSPGGRGVRILLWAQAELPMGSEQGHVRSDFPPNGAQQNGLWGQDAWLVVAGGQEGRKEERHLRGRKPRTQFSLLSRLVPACSEPQFPLPPHIKALLIGTASCASLGTHQGGEVRKQSPDAS